MDKCISWVNNKSFQLSCKYTEAFLKVQITCFYISHLPPTQPSCSWLTLSGHLVDDDLITYGHSPPSQQLLEPDCTRLRGQGPQGPAHVEAHHGPDSFFPLTSLGQLQTLRESLFFFTYCTPPPPPPNKGSETVTRSRQKTALIWTWLAVLRQGYVTCDMISSIHTPFPQKNLVVFAQPTDVQQAHLWVKWTRNTVYGTGPHCVWRQEAVRTGGLEARCWLTLPRMGHRLLSDCWVQDQLCPYWVQDQLCPYWRGLLNFPFLMSKRTPTSNKVVHIVEEEKQWLDFSLSGKLIQIYIWQFSPDKGAIPWWLRW